MSAQKLAEAEKLLERGKVAEAIQALKGLVSADPGNQTYVTKLAAAYLESGDVPAAVDVLHGYAKRVAKAGKPQLAVAILRQALDHDPENVGLLEEYAVQCEASGKLSEAANMAQKALAILIPRKKYFDALNLFPLLVRVAPKEERFKSAWVEVMGTALAEQKLVHLLVALLGPPGLASEFFETGGDPTDLSEDLFSPIAALVRWFPRDPKVPYAVAWAHYRRKNLIQCYVMLREALRRDPDFTMAALLLARILAEENKLNECLFVFRYVKERAISDRQVPSPVLNKQIAAFEEKNGWISFSEGEGAEEMSAEDFVSSIKGKKQSESVPGAGGSAPREVGVVESGVRPSDVTSVTLPGEVELGREDGSGAIILASGEEKKIQAEGIPAETEAAPEVVPKEVPHEEAPHEEMASPVEEAPVADAAPVEEPPQEEPAPSPLDLVLSLRREVTLDRKPMEEREEEVTRVSEVVEPAEPEEGTQVIRHDLLKEMLQETPLVEPPAAEPTGTSATGSLLESIRETEFTSPLGAIQAARDRGYDFGSVEEEVVDLGEDLLSEPTRMIESTRVAVTAITSVEATKETPQEEIPLPPSCGEILAAGDAELAAGKFHLARRTYRQALALGADASVIRERLRAVRAREFPDGLYTRLSADDSGKESIKEIVDRLVVDFQLEESAGRSQEFRLDVPGLVRGHDPSALLDFGVGLLEMGLAAEAESVWSHVRRNGTPEQRLKAAGLVAESRRRRGDYPGAVALLRRLVSDPSVAESDRVPLLFSLGESLEKMKRVEESRQCFLEVSRLDPNYRNVRDKVQ